MIKIEQITISDYFYIYEALQADQYELVKNANGRFAKGKVIEKSERTPEFMFEVKRGIIKHLSGLSEQYTMDDTFILLAWEELNSQYSKVTSLILNTVESEKIDEEFKINSKIVKFEPLRNWTFNKWVVLENAMKGEQQEINGEIKTVHHGAKFLLPVCFGEWNDAMPDFQEKFDYFNYEVSALDLAVVFSKVNNVINNLKYAYRSIYPIDSENDEEQKKENKNYLNHVDMFGWQETLRMLAERQVFGNYLQLKTAPMLEVLEYLNCSISSEISKAEDFNTKK